MANFNVTGLGGLALSLEEVADLPEDVLLEMLSAEGEVIKTAQVQKIEALHLVDSGQMRDSITVDDRLRGKGGYAGGTTRYINVYPKGIRKDRKSRNAEVAFLEEFGAPRRGIAPRNWMRTANEEAADRATQAAAEVYDCWLKGKGL